MVSPKQLFFVQAKPAVDQARWDRDIFQRSLFVLTTNEEIDTREQEQELLERYKDQHHVERGFRFIKDPKSIPSSIRV